MTILLYRIFLVLSSLFLKKTHNADIVALRNRTQTERSEGEDLGALPQTPPKPFLEERFRNPKNFTEKGIPPTNGTRKLSGASVGGMPFSVKVLGVLRPFFQEGSKQGLGQSPKVFPHFLCDEM